MYDIKDGNVKMIEAIDSGAEINLKKVVRNLMINQNKIIDAVLSMPTQNIFGGIFK